MARAPIIRSAAQPGARKAPSRYGLGRGDEEVAGGRGGGGGGDDERASSLQIDSKRRSAKSCKPVVVGLDVEEPPWGLIVALGPLFWWRRKVAGTRARWSEQISPLREAQPSQLTGWPPARPNCGAPSDASNLLMAAPTARKFGPRLPLLGAGRLVYERISAAPD